MNKTCTKEQKEQIEDMTNEGVSDAEIFKIFNLAETCIGKITTNYWKNKMMTKNAKEADIDYEKL